MHGSSLSACRRRKRVEIARIYIGSICTDSLRHGNGLSALLLLTRAAKSSAAKSSASKTRSMESRLNINLSAKGGDGGPCLGSQ